MTVIVSAYPGLGKTTITNSDKNMFFDMEVYESRATKGLSENDINKFFSNVAENINLIYNSNAYEYIFVTDDFRLLKKLEEFNMEIVYILPNPYKEKDLENYINRLIKRSGKEWFDRVMIDDMRNLKDKITYLKNNKKDVRLVGYNQYIEDLLDI